MAKRKIPKWGDFKLYGSLKYKRTGKDEDRSTRRANHTTKSYTKSELAQLFTEFADYFEEANTQSDST